MRREIAVWKVLVAVLAVLAGTMGGAVALAIDEPTTQVPPPDPRGALTPTRSTTYVPLTPCRIFSTTSPSIPALGVEQSRFVTVVGDLSGQGGQAAGCGIPAAATGIEASISATFNQGPGYVRAWPAGQPEPQATFLNYTDAGAATNTGALTLASGGGNGFVIKNYRSVTDVVIDVQGYYIRPIYALVNAEGTVQGSSRLVSVTRAAPGSGTYTVDFDVDTDTCSRTVTVGRSRTGAESATSGFATAHLPSDDSGRIEVRTYSATGGQTDRPFMIEVTC